MPKHSLASALVPDSAMKRRHPLSQLQNEHPVSTPFSFDIALSDELIITVFSYLSYRDLCALQRTNKTWARLTLDNQLWSSLYLREFGGSRLKGSRGTPGYIVRADGQEIRPLPSRVQIQAQSIKDWKWMFRVSSNWRTGRCITEELTWHDSEASDVPHHLVLAGGLIITASPLPSPSPLITLHRPSHAPYSFSASTIPPNPFNKITALALDQSQPTGSEYRLIVFYSTGHFCLFRVFPSNPRKSIEILSHVPSNMRLRAAPILHAAYHHPLLVTLSTSFDLSLYKLTSEESRDLHSGARLVQTLSSFTSYPPASMGLSNPSPNVYKLILAYSVPIYPSHWTVAVTELGITSFAVQSTQTTSALDFCSTHSPLTPALWESLRDQQSRKLSQVSSTSTDGKYVTLAGSGTNVIQLYRLSSRSRSAGPKLTFTRTLHGHINPVQALCVADGRCVSLSRDGALWVWDLERGGVEVESKGLTDLPESARVIFDERRIFIILDGRIIVKSFDM